MGAAVSVVEKSKDLSPELGKLGGKVVEMSKELPAVVGNMGGKAGEKWKELSPEIGKLGGKVVEKSKELSIVVGKLGGKVIQVSKPYAFLTVEKVIQVSKPYAFLIVAGAAVGIILYYFPSCGGAVGKLVIKMIKGIFKMIKGIFNCFYRGVAGGGKLAVKMMKAPGKSFILIPRDGFESNPRAYFRGLRGKSP